MVTFGSLFAGIGGIDLGLERAGFTPRWQVEIDPWRRNVLAKHWPSVARYTDVREVGRHTLEPVDLICGGFPCQDLSYAGKGAGIKEGTRSGLWFEFARIVRELRPRHVLVENVPALRSRGLGIVLGDLASCGYDTEWDCIPAAALGAPHRRDRIWIVAHRQSEALGTDAESSGRLHWTNEEFAAEARLHAFGDVAGLRTTVPDANDARLEGRNGEVLRERSGELPPRAVGAPMADTDRDGGPPRLGDSDESARGRNAGGGGSGADVADADATRWDERPRFFGAGWRPESTDGSGWLTEPNVGRVAHGVPARVDRLRALGDAVVPQVAEYVGRLILAESR